MTKSTSDKSGTIFPIRRRDVLRGAAAVGAATLLRPIPGAYAAAAGEGYAKLPARGEFLIRNAYVLTMDDKLGDLPNGDIHVRHGAIVAVGTGLKRQGGRRDLQARGQCARREARDCRGDQLGPHHRP